MPVVKQSDFPNVIPQRDKKLRDMRVDQLQESLSRIGKEVGYKKSTCTVGGCTLMLNADLRGGQEINMKLDLVENAVQLVHGSNYGLPNTLRFYLTANRNQGCEAYIRCSSLATKDVNDMTIYVGAKFDEYAPGKDNNANTVKGGMGSSTRANRTVRGVQDHVYDMAHPNMTKAIKDRLQALVVHEIGHILHAHHNLNKFLILKTSPNLTTPGPVNAKVSQYCLNAQNGLELVAEVFCGMVHGLQYPQDVMQYYNLCGGP